MRREYGKAKLNPHVRLLLTFIIIVAVCFVAWSCGLSGKVADLRRNSDYDVLSEVPDWSGEPSVEVYDNKPEFERSEIRKAEKSINKGKRFQAFTEMDKLDRCGSAIACVGSETMPVGERESIGMVKPSGWQISKYDFIDNGGYLYNRCHLIGWQLTGENEEVRNLITGTRYMNVQGMLPFENRVAEYVRKTGNHVLYRATPVFSGDELVARGVELEAYSVEDGGGLSFNVYCYNVQPGVDIDYKTGKNSLDESSLPESLREGKNDGAGDSTRQADGADAGTGQADEAGADSGDSTEESGYQYPDLEIPDGVTYILNKNTMRFHRTDCEGAKTIREHNREWFYGTRQEAIDDGFVSCGMCKP